MRRMTVPRQSQNLEHNKDSIQVRYIHVGRTMNKLDELGSCGCVSSLTRHPSPLLLLTHCFPSFLNLNFASPIFSFSLFSFHPVFTESLQQCAFVLFFYFWCLTPRVPTTIYHQRPYQLGTHRRPLLLKYIPCSCDHSSSDSRGIRPPVLPWNI